MKKRYEMNCLVVGQVRRLREGPAGGGARARGQIKRRIKLSKQVSIGPARLLLAATILVTSSLVFRVTSARYVHPTYKFRSELDEDLGRLERHAASGGGPARRQDFDNSDGDGDGDDDVDDNDDQNTAASYQNQDDNQGNNGGGGATDGYDDTEPDGPYEETPVEQEGQADLERFFDDHLGASDRDGMDKENLPSNLITLLSEPPLAQSLVSPLLLMPFAQQQQQQQQQQAKATVSNSITVMPMASVVNQQVRPIRRSALDSALARDPLEMMSSIQETSFIRLPDEKMIVTHQVTARNRPSAPLKLKMSPDDGDNLDEDDESARYRPQRTHYDGRRTPAVDQRKPSELQARARVVPSVRATTVDQQLGKSGGDSLAARGSEIVAALDEDDDRVYVTNATDKPFRIADLGGYDPEEDFIDAAEELEVMASAHDQPRRPTTNNQRQIPSDPELLARRRAATRARPNDDDQYAWAASSADRWHQAPGDGQDVMSFRVPETDQLYGDASETDEITFGQDDPYQTDLEAEMRQQEYDKISGWRREPGPARRAATENPNPIDESQPDVTSGSSNMAVDNGEQTQPSDDKNDVDDDEIDNEYQSEPRVEQTEARSTRARSRPIGTLAAISANERKDEFDDEGSWANDGVEEMDIPSQEHQNTVLEKAAKKEEEEAARRAAADGVDQPEDQSRQESDGESERMPNADYLKNDLKDDDSGYAKAA